MISLQTIEKRENQKRINIIPKPKKLTPEEEEDILLKQITDDIKSKGSRTLSPEEQREELLNRFKARDKS